MKGTGWCQPGGPQDNSSDPQNSGSLWLGHCWTSLHIFHIFASSSCPHISSSFCYKTRAIASSGRPSTFASLEIYIHFIIKLRVLEYSQVGVHFLEPLPFLEGGPLW